MNFQRTLDLSYEKIVLGADLDALKFSYNNNIPIFSLRALKPHTYDVKCNEKNINLYNKIFHELIIQKNLYLFSNLIISARIVDDNTINLVSKNNILVKLKYNKLFLFDDYNLEGLSSHHIETNSVNLVNDYFRLTSTINNDIVYSTSDSFINRVFLFKLDTDKRVHPVTASLIDSSDLNKIEWSPIAAKFKLLKFLKEKNFKGRWDKTNNMYKCITLTHVKREVFPMWKNIYTDLPPTIEQINATSQEKI